MIFVPKHIARPDPPPPTEGPRGPEHVPAAPSGNERPFPTVLQALGLLLLAGIFQFLAAIPFEFIEMDGGTPLSRHPASLAVVNLVSFGLVIAWGTRRANAPAAAIYPMRGVGPVRLAWVGALILGTSILLSDADNLLRSLLPPPPEIVDLFDNVLSVERAPLGTFLALVIVAPLTEELLFRGLILRGFVENYGRSVAIVSSALLFSLIHVNPWQLFPAFVAGLVLAWLALESGSLVPCIFAHAVNNSLGFFTELLPFEIPGFTGGLAGPVEFQPLWFDALGLVLFAAGFAALWRGFRRPPAAGH